jgi:hypothetical protein
MMKVLAFMESFNAALEAGAQAVVASYGLQSIHKAASIALVVVGGAFAAGGGTIAWVSFQKDLPGRVTSIERELVEKRAQDEELYKMVCEIRATIRGLDPLACWRGDIDINLPGGR